MESHRHVSSISSVTRVTGYGAERARHLQSCHKNLGIHRCKLELTKRECESEELSRLVGGRVVFFVSHRLNDVVTWYHLVLSSN